MELDAKAVGTAASALGVVWELSGVLKAEASKEEIPGSALKASEMTQMAQDVLAPHATSQELIAHLPQLGRMRTSPAMAGSADLDGIEEAVALLLEAEAASCRLAAARAMHQIQPLGGTPTHPSYEELWRRILAPGRPLDLATVMELLGQAPSAAPTGKGNSGLPAKTRLQSVLRDERRALLARDCYIARAACLTASREAANALAEAANACEAEEGSEVAGLDLVMEGLLEAETAQVIALADVDQWIETLRSLFFDEERSLHETDAVPILGKLSITREAVLTTLAAESRWER